MDNGLVLCLGLIVGVILTLYFIGKRPVNVNLNVDARASANGGSAHVSAPSSSSPVSSGGASVGGFVGGIFNFFKFLVVATIAILVLSALTQKNEPAQVTVNVPEQKPPVINIPAQQPPIVNVPAQQPPVINVPAQQPPIVNVPPQKAPVVNVAASDGLNYVNTILSLLGVIIGGLMLLFVIRRKPNRGPVSSGEDHSNAEYVRTDYGYTLAKKPSQSQPTTSEYPDLFTRDKVRK